MFTVLMAMCRVHRFNCPLAILLVVQILELPSAKRYRGF